MTQRKRKANFTLTEQEALVNAVNENIVDIQTRGNGERFRQARSEAWQRVLVSVNANCCSDEPRTVAEVQKKYSEMKSGVKKRILANKIDSRVTGGGPSSERELNPLEQSIAQSICEEEVTGIPDGFELGGVADVSEVSTFSLS